LVRRLCPACHRTKEPQQDEETNEHPTSDAELAHVQTRWHWRLRREKRLDAFLGHLVAIDGDGARPINFDTLLTSHSAQQASAAIGAFGQTEATALVFGDDAVEQRRGEWGLWDGCEVQAAAPATGILWGVVGGAVGTAHGSLLRMNHRR
jgi:hypothetical protein